MPSIPPRWMSLLDALTSIAFGKPMSRREIQTTPLTSKQWEQLKTAWETLKRAVTASEVRASAGTKEIDPREFSAAHYFDLENRIGIHWLETPPASDEEILTGWISEDEAMEIISERSDPLFENVHVEEGALRRFWAQLSADPPASKKRILHLTGMEESILRSFDRLWPAGAHPPRSAKTRNKLISDDCKENEGGSVSEAQIRRALRKRHILTSGS